MITTASSQGQKSIVQQKRRQLFLSRVNFGWLLIGLSMLIAIPFFPSERGIFLYLAAVILPSYFLIRFWNKTGKTQLASVLLIAAVNFGCYGLFLILANEYGAENAFHKFSPVWMLMVLSVAFAGILLTEWASFVMALIDSILLFATRLILAPQADPQIIVLFLWWAGGLATWSYEHALSQTLSQVWTDLAEHRQTEEEIRKLSGAVAHSPVSIVITDMEGLIEYVNPRFTEVTGYVLEEVLGQNPRILQSGLTPREIYPQLWDTIKSGKDWRGEFINKKKNGDLYWESASISPIKNGGGVTTHFVAIQEDITERKNIEQVTALYLKRLEQSERVAKLGSWEFDVISQKGWWSRQMFQLLGFAEADRPPGFAMFLAHIHPEDRPLLASDIQNMIAGQEISAREFRIDPEIAPARILQSTLSVEKDAEGRVIKIIGTVIDITERRLMEQSLHESEARFRTLVEQMPAITYIAANDEKSTTLYVSPQIEKYIDPSSKDHETWVDFLHPEDKERVLRELDESHKLGKPFESEYRILAQDGRVVWFHDSTTFIRDDAGKPVLIQGLMLDITERKNVENELRESEALYRLAIETAGAVPYREVYPEVSPKEGNVRVDYQFIGEGIRQITGYGPEEFTAVVWSNMIMEMHPLEDLAKYEPEEAVQRVRSGQNPIWKCDFKIRARDGSIHWVFEAAVELRDENGVSHGSIGLYQDITERKRAEEAVYESERRYRALFEQNQDAIFILDIEGRYVGANKRAEEMLGYTLEEFLNLSINDISAEPAQSEIVRKRLLNGEQIPLYVRLFRKKNKDIFPVEINVELVRDMYGKPLHIQSVVRDITERKQAEAKIRLQIQRLSALSSIDNAISTSLDMRLTLSIFLREVISQLEVDAADVLLLNPYLQSLEFVASEGFRFKQRSQETLRVGQGLAGQIARTRESMSVYNLAHIKDDFVRGPLHVEEGFIAYFGVPLIAKGQLKGVLEVLHRSPLAPDPDWMEFLNTLAGQAAIAIDNSQLFENLQRSNLELTLAYDATIAGWSHAMDLRDKETEGHTRRVTDLTLKLAKRLGISEQEQIHMRRGALLHDIGKLGVPDHILLKEGALTHDEWIVMREHPRYAYDMLASVAYLKSALDIPYCHHEKWDGSGYPRGLKREEIPLAARIFAVVDVWDALSSDRPYREGWEPEQIIEYIREQSGKHFDPHVVTEFMNMMNETFDF